MWEIPSSRSAELSRHLPCVRCGHAVHVFHSCGNGCGCTPVLPVGEQSLVA